MAHRCAQKYFWLCADYSEHSIPILNLSPSPSTLPPNILNHSSGLSLNIKAYLTYYIAEIQYYSTAKVLLSLMVLDHEIHSEKNKNIEGLGIPSLLVGGKKE